jgi:hypothetical protein
MIRDQITLLEDQERGSSSIDKYHEEEYESDCKVNYNEEEQQQLRRRPQHQSQGTVKQVLTEGDVEFLEDIPGDKEFYHSYVCLPLVCSLPWTGLCGRISIERNKDHLCCESFFKRNKIERL